MENGSSLCLSGAVPIALTEQQICNRGFYCPNNNGTVSPQYCAPTKACQILRLQTGENTCATPQGTYEPIVCAKGHYCPFPGRQRLLCPVGHYCPLGTETPFKCSLLSICPSGSIREFKLEGFIVALLVDIALLLLMFGPACLGSIRGTSRKSRKNSNFSEEAPTVVEEVPPLAPFCVALDEKCQVRISLTYKSLAFTINSDTLVSSVSGSIETGSLCGLLGPSGAGKTTLMRLLMGKLQRTGGDVTVNGLSTTLSRHKKLIGYVPSDDILSPLLTVRENILHSCRVRGPRAWSDRQRNTFTENVMHDLGISHIEDHLVGDSVMSSISTGQRRRVSIAIELVTNPAMLFLDEPTSGLDATTAMSLIQVLKRISVTGVTVVCILHQPREEIFNMLDHVTLLAKGKQLFQGPPQEAVTYFNDHGYEISSDANPADVLLDIAAGKEESSYPYIASTDAAQRLAQMWEQQHCIQQEAAEHSHCLQMHRKSRLTSSDELKQAARLRGAPWLRQVQYCCVRAMRQQLRQPATLLLEIAVGGVAGLLIGLGLYPNKGTQFQGVYLPPFELLSSAADYTTVPKIGELIALATALAAAAPGVSIFGDEKSLYWREAAAGHLRSAYFVGKVLATIPRMTLSALHFTSFFAILSTPSMNFWVLYLMTLLYFYCVYGLASVVSVAARPENGTLLAMILCLIIGAFGGYAPMLTTVQSWHLEWAWRMCPGTWLTEAYLDQTLKKSAYLYDVQAAAAWTGFHLGRTPLDMTMIFIIGSVYRVMAFSGLVSFNRDKQR